MLVQLFCLTAWQEIFQTPHRGWSNKRHWPNSCHSEITGVVHDVFSGNWVWPKPAVVEDCSLANAAGCYSRQEWSAWTGCTSAGPPGAEACPDRWRALGTRQPCPSALERQGRTCEPWGPWTVGVWGAGTALHPKWSRVIFHRSFMND